MIIILRRFLLFIKKPQNSLQILVGFAFLGCSVWLNFQAGTYAYHSMSNGVADVILDNIPVYNVSLLFVQGAVLMVCGVVLLCVIYPHKMFDMSASIALLYLIRSAAISLTHLGPPLAIGSFDLADTITGRFMQGADYFFSGHTALPFLVALLFWEKPLLRNCFFICTIIFGAAALMGHVHYSIDVFAAPFIAYGVFAIRKYLWKPSV